MKYEHDLYTDQLYSHGRFKDECEINVVKFSRLKLLLQTSTGCGTTDMKLSA